MSPGERVYAAVPAVFGSLPDDQPPNRLGLAPLARLREKTRSPPA